MLAASSILKFPSKLALLCTAYLTECFELFLYFQFTYWYYLTRPIKVKLNIVTHTDVRLLAYFSFILPTTSHYYSFLLISDFWHHLFHFTRFFAWISLESRLFYAIHLLPFVHLFIRQKCFFLSFSMPIVSNILEILMTTFSLSGCPCPKLWLNKSPSSMLTSVNTKLRRSLSKLTSSIVPALFYSTLASVFAKRCRSPLLSRATGIA